MTEETSQDKSWLSEVSWKATVVYVVLSIIGGGATGAGLIATKAVSAQPNNGITQDQADVRYLSKTEAETRRDARDRQLEELKKAVLTREVFEAYHKADADRMQRLEKLAERILENQTAR